VLAGARERGAELEPRAVHARFDRRRLEPQDFGHLRNGKTDDVLQDDRQAKLHGQLR